MNIKDKIQNQKCVFGTWCMLPSDFTIDVICKTDLDYIIIDMEHGMMSWETSERMVRAAESNSVIPIIRVPNCEENTILHALETNVKSILVPHISTPSQAKKVALSTKYAPQGNRGLSPYTRCHSYDHEGLSDSLISNNRSNFLGILVEGKEGIENLQEIVKVEGVDMIYLGIYDVAQSLGLSGNINHPECKKALKDFLKIIKYSGKLAGTFTRTIEDAKKLKEDGFEFIAYRADSNALKTFYTNAVKGFWEDNS